MKPRNRFVPCGFAGATWAIAALMQSVSGQAVALDWDQIRARVLAQNPTILAGQINIDESRANEITAGLRPNPEFNFSTDGFQVAPHDGIYRPLSGVVLTPGVSQLIERGNKRQLRVSSARLATSGATSDQEDLKRTLLFSVRTAFVGVLQAKALLDLAQMNLQYYDNVIDLNRTRFQAGDISELDFQRVEMQRVSFESDVSNARLNVQTSKLQLLALLNERTAVEDFDVTGDIDYKEPTIQLPEMRQNALQNRPDLRSAENAIDKARADNRLAIANGTADPTVSGWYSHNPSFSNPFDFNTIGASISIPIRIFDKNQGEKARTASEIQRTERARDAVIANIYRDVDTAFAALQSARTLIQPYRDKYLKEVANIRDKVSLSYNQGNSTLLEFLDAQRQYRDTLRDYINLEGTYWNSLAQLGQAVGQEVNP